MAKQGHLLNTLLFLFIDSSTTEAAVAKGNSPSPHLFELIIKWKGAKMRYGFRSHVIYILGTRMIYQKTNGASRGRTKCAKVLSKPIRKFASNYLKAFERS